MLSNGCFAKSSGIIQLWFEEEFSSSTGDTTLVFSIAMALQMLLGPLTSTVCNLTSCRTSVFVGGIIVTIGVLLAGFSSDIWLVLITYGIIGGVGRAFSYCPAITIIGLHFKDKSGFPVGLASSGSGFGALIFPFIVEWAFQTYGFTGALIILGGMVLNICVFGSLFTPIKRKSCSNFRKLVDLGSSQEMQPENKNKYNRFTSVVFNKPLTMKTSVKEKKKMFNFKILKNSTFTLFCFGLGITCGNRIFHFLPSMARQKGINDLQTTSLLSISGVFETISRIFSGIVFDTNFFKNRRMIAYNGLMYAFGILTLILPYLDNYTTYAVICALSGAVMGAIASQKTVIIIDILGPEHICDANGILTFFRGIGALVGPPIAGWYFVEFRSNEKK
ncbi:hypothetical protein KUTeg_018141 [Tegillarca granosa]|uniref:Major facilitator superfamily (MFS) profile domain-containing protein n=1 Tax=Tegillarca granosa TaxID=220873 RepID=A0ABQ9EMR9_TEGGR|nr:hypothetical protein KUTeg_018141 [Tegillarca granosa]